MLKQAPVALLPPVLFQGTGKRQTSITRLTHVSTDAAYKFCCVRLAKSRCTLNFNWSARLAAGSIARHALPYDLLHCSLAYHGEFEEAEQAGGARGGGYILDLLQPHLS